MTRRTTALPRALAAAALFLAVAGCGSQGDDAATEPATGESASESPEPTPDETPDETEESPMPSQTPGGPGGTGGAAQEAAVADLAERLGVSAEDITVASTDAVTWRDGSLGCAAPDMMYTQALVEGTRIVLEADGQRYEYHAGGNRPAFLCEKPTQ